MIAVSTVRHRGIEYYFRPEQPGVRPEGHWLGATADELGLLGRAVTRRDLAVLTHGVDPLTGEVLNARHTQVRVAVYDYLLCPPKSVSVLGALGESATSEAVHRAHGASVEVTLGYLERHFAGVRRGEPRRACRAGGIAAAVFGHETSRAGDPHLHSHALIANLAHDESGRWSALDSQPLFARRSEAEAIYQCQLRYELTRRLDVAFRRRSHGGLDLVGLSDGVLSAFSQRQRQIEAFALAEGVPRRSRLAANMTRPPKDSSRDAACWREQWWERANRLGVSASRLAAIAPERPAERDGAARDGELEVAVRAVVAGMPGPFLRGDALRLAAANLVDGAALDDLEHATDRVLRDAAVRDRARPFAAARGRSRAGASVPVGRPEARYLASVGPGRDGDVLGEAPRERGLSPAPRARAREASLAR